MRERVAWKAVRRGAPQGLLLSDTTTCGRCATGYRHPPIEKAEYVAATCAMTSSLIGDWAALRVFLEPAVWPRVRHGLPRGACGSDLLKHPPVSEILHAGSLGHREQRLVTPCLHSPPLRRAFRTCGSSSSTCVRNAIECEHPLVPSPRAFFVQTCRDSAHRCEMAAVRCAVRWHRPCGRTSRCPRAVSVATPTAEL